MNTQVDSESAQTLMQYGPYAFVLLFIGMFSVCLTMFAKVHRQLRKAECRPDPPISSEERESFNRELGFYRKTLYAISSAAFAMVIIGTVWWIVENQHTCSKPDAYVYEGVIEDLQPFHGFYSADIYMQRLELKDAPEAPPTHHVRFAITRDRPFTEGEGFPIGFYRIRQAAGDDGSISHDPNSGKKLSIRYVNAATTKHRLKMDPKTGDLVLEPQVVEAVSRTTDKSHTRTLPRLLLGIAHAQNDKGYDPTARAPTPQWNTVAPPPDFFGKVETTITPEQAIAKLISERSSVTEKITSLDALAKLREPDLNRAFTRSRSSPQAEPLELTILDLARHTDMELAFKANRLAKTANIEKRLVESLSRVLQTNSQDGTKWAIGIIKRLEPAVATDVVKAIASRIDNSQVARIKDTATQPDAINVLYPTGSAKGDRYYVKAIWHAGDTQTVDCLAQMYSTTLLQGKSADKEVERMQDKTHRTIYWYSKNWALDIAEQIRTCGARAEFVNWKSAS